MAFAVVGAVSSPIADDPTTGSAPRASPAAGCRVEIDKKSRAIRTPGVQRLRGGETLAPEVVRGILRLRAGVGWRPRNLPPFEDGPGNGQWNLGKYLVARASDLPLHRLETEILAPVSPKEPPKGMAEVVMIPVVSALLNAIHDATGKRFYSLPVTPSMLQGAIS
jgi:hypothetical protein